MTRIVICTDSVLNSYVTGPLSRTHPLVQNGIMDDRALDGIWLGDHLTALSFVLYSFKTLKVVCRSNPRHFHHILLFLTPYETSRELLILIILNEY